MSEEMNTPNPESKDKTGCARCSDDLPLDFLITMAYQPIVDLRDNSIFAYEALVLI